MTGRAPDPFAVLQGRLRGLPAFDELGRSVPCAAIALPSLDLGPSFLDTADLASLETRWLYVALLLQRPLARVAIITSGRITEDDVDALLDLLPDPAAARARLELITVDDASPRPLAAKVVDRPDIGHAIRLFAGPDPAFLMPFAVGRADRRLALQLGIPILGIDTRFGHHGTKSGGRRLLVAAGVPVPAGEEDVWGCSGAVAALKRLRARRPMLAAAVVTLDVGTTGNGNRVLSLAGLPAAGAPGEAAALGARLDALDAPYREALARGGIVEELVSGAELRSPSAQVRIEPDGRCEVIATHDQLLTGADAQAYAGCRFPAPPEYAAAIAELALRVARSVAAEGAIGRLAVDFVVARDELGGWQPHAVEVNLREGATTHPLATLALLTGGRYDAGHARFTTAAGASRCYHATDSLRAQRYRAVAPARLRAALAERGLAYDRAAETGIVLYMLRALPRDGRLSVVAIGRTAAHADALYAELVAVLDDLAQDPEAATLAPVTSVPDR